MNCAVSSIQPESSTAPACRNISHGERACRAPAASAAACDPSNGRKRQPATSATRSITPERARSTSSTSQTTPAAAPGTSAARVATAGCSTPSVGMMTLSTVLRCLKDLESGALLSPRHNQISLSGAAFCGNRGRRSASHLLLFVYGRLFLMFLICSRDMLCSGHESSILSSPQAPAGHGALRAAGGALLFFRDRRRERARA